MSELSLIQNRVREVEALIGRHRHAVEALEAELKELEISARVLARLTGASGGHSGAEDASEAEETGGGKPEGIPTIPVMITTVMRDAAPTKLEPRQVADAIRQRWWPGLKGAKVSSIMWRMKDRGDLVKMADAALYSLPDTDLRPSPDVDEAADNDPSREPSAASLFTLAEGPETPGGGG